ncbi:S-layer homology domain-containing protein [Cohnella herbarum]|uniref:SLH domain-containing protein n=1 Tax=Cohnella herbarum TaxID=2728023 RepID=A0A7Z2ZMH7_9BACL|nr:S-layer homology domain-containing protein [Cohnella herbarum]QJD84994.1 hypothetical protein HH215_18605 [Cohnella herbarum]
MNRKGLKKMTVMLMVVSIIASMFLTMGTLKSVYAEEDTINFAGGEGTLENPYKIATVENLRNVTIPAPGAYFQQVANFSLTGNWTPIGSFGGIYDGAGFTIENMVIHSSSANGYVGLFSILTNGAILDNMRLEYFSITETGDNSFVGGLAGLISAGATVRNSSSNGTISFTDSSNVGGLTGYNEGSIINGMSNSTIMSGGESFSAGSLVGTNVGTISVSSGSGSINLSNSRTAYVGGLVGMNAGTVSTSNSSSLVIGGEIASAGGLVGTNYSSSGIVNDSYSTGNASGTTSAVVGGLVGRNSGDINRSYSTGNAETGSSGMAGGLVGYKQSGNISNSFSRGNAIGNAATFVGGLVGFNSGGDVSYSYSTGSASGGNDATGGLIGFKQGPGTVTNSYYNNAAAATSSGGEAKSAVQLMQQLTFVGWVFGANWRIAEGYAYPSLQWQAYSASESIFFDHKDLTWDNIKGTNGSEDEVTDDLTLPATGAAGSTIFWSVSAGRSDLIDTSSGKVTRATDDDHIVTLTATVSRSGGQALTKDFTLKIIEAPNNKPIRKSNVNGTANATVSVNSAYALNLSEIFEDVDGDPLSYKVSVNGAPTIAAAATYTYTPVSAGLVTLVFSASDEESDSDDTYTVNLTGNTVPVRQENIEATTTAVVTVNTPYSLDLSTIFEDADSNLLSYKVSVNGAPTTTATESYAYTPTTAGLVTLIFTANDNNVDSAETYTVELTANTLPVRKPNVSASANVAVTVNTPYILDLSSIFEDADGNQLSYKVSVDGAPTVAAAATYTYTPTATDLVTLVFTANDGNIDSMETYTVNLTGNTMPVRNPNVDATATAVVTVNTPYSLDLSAIFEDEDSNALTYKVSVNGAPEIAAAEIFSYTPTDKDLVTLVFTANDGLIDSTDTYTVELAVNSLPVRKSDAGATVNASVPVNTPYTLDLSTIFEDENGDQLSYKVSVAGAPTIAAGATYTYTPTTANTVVLVFTANDGRIDSTETYTVNLSGNTIPVRKSGVEATVQENVRVNANYALNLSPIFEDADGDTLTYEVSVNGAAAVAAFTAYAYTPTIAGTVTLVFTANDGKIASTDTYTVTLRASRPETSESGSGNGGGGSPAATPDYHVTISGTETTLPVEIDAKTGRASIIVGALAEKLLAGGQTTEITVPIIPGIKTYTLEVAAEKLSSSPGAGELIFTTQTGSIAIPSNMLEGVAGTKGKMAGITVGIGDKAGLSAEAKTAVGNRPLVELTLALDGVPTPWNNPAAAVRISIPYVPTAEESKNPEYIVVWYIDGSGKVIAVPSGRYDAKSGTVTFVATHFSDYAIAYAHKTFSDLSSVEWARRSIEVIASKGIINGTVAGTYSPAARITRADYLVLLVKTLGLTAKLEGNFADVERNAYYYEALGVAKRLGLATGTGQDEFHPLENISRQDMMVLTARALEKAKQLKASGDPAILASFSDKGDIAAYAEESLAVLAKEGLVTGSGDKLNPRAPTTRAEAAVFLYRIYNRY